MPALPNAPALLAAALVVASFAGCVAWTGSEAGAPAIVIAMQPTDSAAKIRDKATELESFLSERTGETVKVVVPLSNAGVVESLHFGHAQAAFMGSWPAQLAVARAGAEIGLAERREVTIGSESVVAPYYYSYYIVRKDSPFTNLTELAGARVAFTSPTSTSGYVYPVAKLVALGLVPKPLPGAEAAPSAFFGSVVFAGGYRQAWEALKNDQVDVTVVAGDIPASLYQEILAETRVVATQGPVPSHAVVFAKGFEGPQREKLEAALLELRGEKRDLMRDLVSGIFVEFERTTSEKHTGPLADALGLAGLKFAEKLG